MKFKMNTIVPNQYILDTLEAKPHEYFNVVTEELLEVIYDALPIQDKSIAIIFGVDGDNVTPYHFTTNHKKRNVGRSVLKTIMENSEIIGEFEIDGDEYNVEQPN